jgi:GntR family transcriptional regulator of gluconate operon
VRPVPRYSLSEAAADRIREEILRGTWRQGDRLVETRLAEQLGVSRGPLREALRTLSTEGLVAVTPRRGTFVVALTRRDVSEIYGLRAAVETHAVALLARSGTEDDFEELRELQERLEDAVAADDPSRAAAADIQFHEAICRLTGNRRLHELSKRDYVALQALIALDDRMYSALDEVLGQHRGVVDAIEARDPELASSLMGAHIDEACQIVIGQLELDRAGAESHSAPPAAGSISSTG